jgi:8-oxo-dGTP diphosphatase
MQEIHVVGAAIRKENKILAAQRSSTMSSPLKWEFPGGKIERGESHSQALRREISEELGVGIAVRNYIASGFYEVGDKRINLHVYEAELSEGVPMAREHSRLKWIEIPQIMKLDWAQPDIPACRELLKRFKMFSRSC